MGLGSGIRDPGSGINLFWIPDPGSRGQKGTGPQIRIRNTAIQYVQIIKSWKYLDFLPRWWKIKQLCKL